MKTSTILKRIIPAGAILAGVLTAVQLQAADTKLSEKASDFIKEASQGNRAEIALAQLAEQKAQNQEIKHLAKQILQDHQTANQKLQSLAQTHAVKLDDGVGLKNRITQERLERLSGAEFDKEYAKSMLKEHNDDIQKFEKAAKEIVETDVKQFAQETLPKLRAHLRHAEQAARAVGIDQATISSLTRESSGAMGGTADQPESSAGAASGADASGSSSSGSKSDGSSGSQQKTD